MKLFLISFFLLFSLSISLFSSDNMERDPFMDNYLKSLSTSTDRADEFEVRNATYAYKVKDRIMQDISRIAGRFDMDRDYLFRLRKKGYGYIELLRLIMISREKEVHFEELIKLRAKKKTFSEIAKQYNLDNLAIKKKAETLKKELGID